MPRSERHDDDLFSPIAIGAPAEARTPKIAKNRFVLAAMTNRQSHPDGSLGEDELAWLAARARGGFGVVTTCAAHVSPEGQGWAGELGVFDDRLVDGLARVAKELHAHGALGLVQIFHGGRRADASVTGGRPLGPSEEEGGPREATSAELERIVADFARGAARAERAGFDGVEIHGAHGYLLTQFLSATENRRADAWGGPLTHRARLIREVTRAVRAATSPSFVVGVRLSLEDFGNAKGLDLDESLQVAAWLADDGVDFIHASLWNARNPTKKRPAEHPTSVLRAALPSRVRLVVAGQIATRADAEHQLELGADLVAIARAAIANPDLPLRAREPGWEPLRPPHPPELLRERAVSDPFIAYLRGFKNLVAP